MAKKREMIRKQIGDAKLDLDVDVSDDGNFGGQGLPESGTSKDRPSKYYDSKISMASSNKKQYTDTQNDYWRRNRDNKPYSNGRRYDYDHRDEKSDSLDSDVQSKTSGSRRSGWRRPGARMGPEYEERVPSSYKQDKYLSINDVMHR